MIQQDHLQVFDLTLKTQSPLFVGSGRKIGKREYIYSLNQGCVKILNMELFFDYMLRHDLVRQFEKFMLSSNSSLLDFWTRDCHLAEDWLEHPKLMGDKPLVQYRLAVTEDVAGYNGTKEIHQFQRDAYGRAYIPGSSLKGALRTAWLVHLLLHETPTPGKKRTLEAFEVNHDYVFPEGSYANKLRSGAAADDILDSIFRGVQVSDSAPIDNDKLILTGRTLISPLSAARVEDFDGDAKDLPLYQECVRPGETIRFRLTLDQSILNRHIHPITKDALLEAIAEFSRFYQDAFLSHFPQGHPVANIPDTPHLILGGGTGFFSKTVGYPYLKDDYAAALFKSRCEDEKRPVHKVYWSFLVGAAGFEPTASSSRTRRATNCAMPRKYRSRLGCGLVGDERIELPQVESESTALPLCKSPLFGLSGAAQRC